MSRPDDFDAFVSLPNGSPNDGSALPSDAPDTAPVIDDADVPLDPALLAAARAYHAPPSPPADAMWAAIQARRGIAAAGVPARGGAPTTQPALALHVGGQREPVRPRAAWSRPARRWAPLAAAAAVLLATGIGIGRYSTSPAVVPPAVVPPASTIASAPAPTGTADPATTPGVVPAPDATRAATPAPRAVAATPRALSASGHRPAAPSLAIAEAAATDRRDASGARDAASAPLRAATDRHLADAEALLTAFAAVDGGAPGQPPSAAPDSAWARDLLVTTRLLLDSPAGRDPSRRTLLESLELVLVQIARLPHTDTPAERALIDRAIRNGDLLARLRTAVPSGPVRRRGGAQGV